MKRWLVRISVLLVLGAIVNVAVAWSSEWLVQPLVDPKNARTTYYRAPSGRQWAINRVVGLSYSHSAAVEWPSPFGVGPANGGGNAKLDAYPRWAVNWPDGLDTVSGPQIVEARGWPMYTLISRFDGRAWVSGIDMRPGALNFSDQRVLPAEIIWPGFAINTVFYALVLWLLFAAPFALRRRRRIKRGLCPKCAYDLRGRPQGSACPECGNIVAS